MARMKAAYKAAAQNRLERRVSAQKLGVTRPSDMNISQARQNFGQNPRANSMINMIEGMGNRLKGKKYNAKADFKNILKGLK